MSDQVMEVKRNTILMVGDYTYLSEPPVGPLSPEYNLISVNTGNGALNLLEKMDVDLVILELKLPDIDGEALIHKIKRIKPMVKVIITGQGDIDSYVRSIRLGAYDYLIKPISSNSLFSVLEKVLTTH